MGPTTVGVGWIRLRYNPTLAFPPILPTDTVKSITIIFDEGQDTAPDNFTRADEHNYSYVFKQPTTDDERALCEEALVSCPVEAIGNDG